MGGDVRNHNVGLVAAACEVGAALVAGAGALVGACATDSEVFAAAGLAGPGLAAGVQAPITTPMPPTAAVFRKSLRFIVCSSSSLSYEIG
jgi:hypothetical protein